MPRTAKANRVSAVVSPIASGREPASPSKRRQSSLRHRTRPTLLWIDDFEPGLALYSKMFENLGIRVLSANSGEVGVQLAKFNPVDVVVTDPDVFMVRAMSLRLPPEDSWVDVGAPFMRATLGADFGYEI